MAIAIRIVDASAIAAVLFVEPQAGAIAARLSGARLLAPTLFSYEVANICVTRLRRAPTQAAATLARYRLLSTYQIEEHEVDMAPCLQLARDRLLTAYDASYLWLARSTGGELVTLDGKLARAAADA